MAEEKILVPAKRKQQLAKLASRLGELGFSSISYTKERLVVEKVFGEDLKGKPNLDYRITFLESSIEMVYGIAPNASKRARMLELLPVLLNVITVSEEYYDVKPSALFPHVLSLLSDVSKVVGKDAMELSAELEGLRTKFNSMNSRYQDLVGSSEENARILLECERRRDELRELVRKLQSMSDDRLKEELYLWLKMHSGDIDITEFGKAHGVAPGRVEEGLDMLIREGYIKRRVD
jgi:predicted transcriptional regulator with HTH domain